ncbi:MAG TPA: efflux RND transporter periplasmic adaptor subunit [Longimicrobiales bacterium]
MALPRRLFSFIAAAVVVLLLGAGIYVRIHSHNAEEEAAASGETDGDQPAVASASEAFATGVAIPVEAAPVRKDTLVISVSAPGQAVAWRQAVVLAQVEGRVERVAVRENERVAADELLLAIESTQYELNLAEARAQMRSAEATYREMILFDDRVDDPVVRAQRDSVARAKSGLLSAQVGLQRAQLDLARTQVTAPFPGRAASIKVVPGQRVSPGDELMTIVDLDPIRVEVQVLEGEVGYLEAGRPARVSFAAFPDETFTGTIETINPLVDEGTRTAKVTVVLDNPDGRILPGMFAQVSLEAQRFPDRILVPRAAILERDGRPMLFVYEDGRAKWRYVTPGLQNETLVEIVRNPDTDMVEPGEQVLVNGHYTLTHDAPVRLVESVREAGGRPN